MKRFGFAIRLGGDPEISGALADGIQRGTPKPAPARTGAASEAVRRVAMHQHTPEEWQAMTAKARFDYGQDPPTPRLAAWLLVGWALMCEGVRWLYHCQDKLMAGGEE